MPMIATTIINSIRVKPFCTDFMDNTSRLFKCEISGARRLQGSTEQSLCQSRSVMQAPEMEGNIVIAVQLVFDIAATAGDDNGLRVTSQTDNNCHGAPLQWP